MKIFSSSKINLFLDIVGFDVCSGYHYIDSIFQEISLYDEIYVEKNNSDKVEFVNIAEIGDNSTVHKALKLCKEHFCIKDNFYIKVKKNVPVGAGLGGGSSNAAFLLKYFMKEYNLPFEDILNIARKIGSDVPFFLYGGLCRVRGKGELIEKLQIKLKDMFFLIIYPDIFVKTAWAYSLIKDKEKSFEIPELKNISHITIDFLEKILYNKFQNFVFEALPDLKRIYESLKVSLRSNILFMSGSGSSLVAVYDNEELAREDRLIVKERFGFFAEVVYPVEG